MISAPQNASRRGNALFLILIAVALFAALSYAITQSGRGGGGNVNNEQATLYAAQITQTAALLRQDVMRFMMSSGIADTAITCMDAPNGTDCGGGSANTKKDLCTTGTTCLFAPEGGAASVPVIPKAALNAATLNAASPVNFSGPTSYRGFTIDGFNGGGEDTPILDIGTAAKETVMWVFHLNKATCTALNRGLGITGAIPQETVWDPVTTTAGYESACFEDGTSGDYVFYQVLVAR